MDILFNSLLIAHIAGGSIGLMAGSYNMITKKGTKLHKQIGLLFFYSLLIAALIALPMSFLHHSYFLFIVGVFTSYLLMTGKRYLAKKDIHDVTNTDWILCWIMLLFGTGFIVWGIYLLVYGNSFGTVLLVFGSISMMLLWQDHRNFKGRSAIKNFGLTNHIQRMIGAYIASLTAFIVVNNTLLPGIVAWLLPTIVLVPVLVKWSGKYAVKA
ncbi:MAG: hypothetical protein IPP72_11000 [Chitinophagaceae bacterium]|nr:hypothetical protein [Chitinophagaceae bacterium]